MKDYERLKRDNKYFKDNSNNQRGSEREVGVANGTQKIVDLGNS